MMKLLVTWLGGIVVLLTAVSVQANPIQEPLKSRPGCPDLVVQSINTPGWDIATSRSVIKAEIKNIGIGEAEKTLARLMDPYTSQHIGVPHTDVVETPALLPGASTTVVFHLPYWPYDPTADFTVTADYKNTLKECKEKNNVKLYNPLN
jgi:subtilase family serine protease